MQKKRVRLIESLTWKPFLSIPRNSVRYIEVSALDHVRFRGIPTVPRNIKRYGRIKETQRASSCSKMKSQNSLYLLLLSVLFAHLVVGLSFSVIPFYIVLLLLLCVMFCFYFVWWKPLKRKYKRNIRIYHQQQHCVCVCVWKKNHKEDFYVCMVRKMEKDLPNYFFIWVHCFF